MLIGIRYVNPAACTFCAQ